MANQCQAKRIWPTEEIAEAVALSIAKKRFAAALDTEFLDEIL
jgi:hypothetical protein